MTTAVKSRQSQQNTLSEVTRLKLDKTVNRFVVVDVETANADYASICQIGVAIFENWSLVDTWETLVNPQCDFSSGNIGIHGITEAHVVDAPKFKDVYAYIDQRMRGQLVISHSLFDRNAFDQAFRLHGLDWFECHWMDSTRVVRRTWPELSKRGYGLSNLKKKFGLEFQHHDALEDAIAAGTVLTLAAKKRGHSVFEMVEFAGHTAKQQPTPKLHLEGMPDRPLSGQVCVLSGEFPSGKTIVADLINQLGAAIHPNVTKKTTMLVKYDLQDPATGKQKKAAQYAANGQSIEIVDLARLILRAKTKLGEAT